MALGDNPWAPENLYSSEYERREAISRQLEADRNAERSRLEADHGGVWGVANTTANTPDANAVLAQQVGADQAAEDQQIEQNLGGGVAMHPGMGIAAGAGGAAQDAFGRADQATDEAFQTYQAPSAPNPVYPIRQEHAAVAQGLMGAQHDAKVATAQATIDAQSAQALSYEAEAGRQQAMIDAQHAKMIRDQQRRDQAIDAERRVFGQIQEASEKLAKAPVGDKKQLYGDMHWIAKIGWAISAIADGMRGLEPMAALDRFLEGRLRDMAANRESLRESLAAQTQQLGHTQSIFNDLRANIGDEDATMDAMRIAQYEQAKAMLMAEQLRNGIPLEAAMQNEGILELDQKINDVSASLRERLAVTPERIGGGTRYVLPSEERRAKLAEAKDERAHGRALQLKGVDVASGAAAQEYAGEADVAKERAKAGGPPEAAQRRIDVDQAKWLAEKVEPYRNEERLITQFREDYKNGIPGLVFGLGWQKNLRTDEAIQAKERLKRIVMVRLRRESGAAISEKELSNDADALLEAMDEDDVNNMLDDRLAEARSRIDYFERAPEEQAVQRVNRAQAGPRAPIASGGSGLPDVFDQYADE